MGIYTDMAKEACLSLDMGALDGLSTKEYKDSKDISVHEVVIKENKAAQAIGKAVGRYVTVEFDDIENSDATDLRRLTSCLSKEIKTFLPDVKHMNCLVVGLGNRAVTPDSIGPKCCDKIFVTRHINEYAPEILGNAACDVSAVASGVLSTTGIETYEMVKSIVNSIRPDVVIAVDALASGSISRIGRSIQITDAGISPGSGIGNKRHALDKNSLGVPVCAVGVPTVVYAGTIAENLISYAVDVFSMKKDDIEKIINMLQEIEGGDLVVAPKNIDQLTDDASLVIADAVNIALNPYMKRSDIPGSVR